MAKTLIGQLEPRDRARVYRVLRYFEVGLERKLDVTGKPVITAHRLPFFVKARPYYNRFNVEFYSFGTTSHVWFDGFNTLDEAVEFAHRVHDAAIEYLCRKLNIMPEQASIILRDVMITDIPRTN